MNFLGNIKIRTKLNMLMVFMVLLLVGVGATGLIGIDASNKGLATVYNDHLLSLKQLNEIRNNQMLIRLTLDAARQETDAFEIMALNDQVRHLIFLTDNILKSYTDRIRLDEERKLMSAFTEARMTFGRDGVIPMMDVLQVEQFAEADKLRKAILNPAYAKASKAIYALITYQVENASKAFDKASRFTAMIRIASISSIAAGLVLIVFVGVVIVRAIRHGVTQLEQGAARLANGDLTSRIHLNGKDELSGVAQVFNKMTVDFGGLIKHIHDSSGGLTTEADKLSSIADTILESTQSQTHQAASVASSVANLNSAVGEIADKTESAASAASTTCTTSEEGRLVVDRAVTSIREIARTVSESTSTVTSLGERSSQIGQIVKVIKDIADQTNLLALNAAIEAARAGEQGRGFAVVADEVRKLAERTANATSEISTMINAIQSETGNVVTTMTAGSEQVNQGVELSNQAGQVLQQINTSVMGMAEMIGQIADLTRSQRTASEEITQQVEQIATKAEANSASINQITHASHGLKRLSSMLQEEVNRFKI